MLEARTLPGQEWEEHKDWARRGMRNIVQVKCGNTFRLVISIQDDGTGRDTRATGI